MTSPTQLSGEYFINHEIRIPSWTNQYDSWCFMESNYPAVFFWPLCSVEHLGVSKNVGKSPKSSILIGCSMIFTIHFGKKSIYFWVNESTFSKNADPTSRPGFRPWSLPTWCWKMMRWGRRSLVGQRRRKFFTAVRPEEKWPFHRKGKADIVFQSHHFSGRRAIKLWRGNGLVEKNIFLHRNAGWCLRFVWYTWGVII